MAFDYVSHDHVQRTGPEPFGASRVYFYDPRADRRVELISARYKRLDPLLEVDDVVVIRGSHPGFAAELERDAVLADLLQHNPVLGLAGSHDRAAREPTLWTPNWSREPGFAISAEDLVQLEIRSILETSGAIFHRDDYHFELPSGLEHADRFVRVAEALYDGVDVVRLVDWLLPHVTAKTAVLTDNGSMLALLFCLQAEARRRFGWDLPISALVEYPTDAREVRQRLREAAESATGQIDKLLIVVSVSSSGNAARLIKRVAPIDHEIVALCDTKPNDPDNPIGMAERGEVALCSMPVDRWEVVDGSCEVCDEFGLLRIHPRSYEVRQDLKFTAKKLPLKKAGLWELAHERAAIALHYELRQPDAPKPRRDHYGIYVDVGRLLADRSFRRRCLQELRRLPRPDAIVIPKHRRSQDLVDLARRAIPGARIEVIEAGKMAEQASDAVVHARRVLILDDAMVTGATLVGMRRELYQVTRVAHTGPEVHACVLLCRPPDDSFEQRIRRNYGHISSPSSLPWVLSYGLDLLRRALRRLGRQQEPPPAAATPKLQFFFSYVEKVYLPVRCSFCAERDTIRLVLDDLEPRNRDLAHARLGQLDSTELVNPILLDHECASGKTEDSAIGALEAIPAYVSAASQTQAHRLGLGENEVGDRISYSDPNFLVDAFYDSVIVAGITRTYTRRDLRTATTDALLDSMMADIGARLGRGCILELGWAAIFGKLPPRGIRKALSEIDDPDGRAGLTLNVLNVLYPPSEQEAEALERAEAVQAETQGPI